MAACGNYQSLAAQNAAVVEGITYPLLFKIYKLKSCLKSGDEYQSKPQIAVEMIREIQAMGFVIERVLADSLYGESGLSTGQRLKNVKELISKQFQV